MKKIISSIILSLIALSPVTAQNESNIANDSEHNKTSKNELSIDISTLFNLSNPSSGLLYKRHVWNHLALRARLGGSYITDSEDINSSTVRKSSNTNFTGGLGIEHSHHVDKFEFIYGVDFLMKDSENNVAVTGLPSTKQTIRGYGISPLIGINYHPNQTIILGIEPESYIGDSTKKNSDGTETESSHEIEFFIMESVSLYIGFKF